MDGLKHSQQLTRIPLPFSDQSDPDPIQKNAHDANYIVRPGDTLSEIARKLGTDQEELLRQNPHIRNPDRIFAGDAIRLGRAPADTPQHVVKSGETLWSIARLHGRSVSEIERANSAHVTNKNLIFPGQVLIIPGPSSTPITSMTPATVSDGIASKTPEVSAQVPGAALNVAAPTTLSSAIILKHRDIRLSPHTLEKMNNIANEYRRLTGKRVTITDGDRTASDQAQRMYDKISSGKADGLYKNKAALEEIKAAYALSKRSNTARSAIVRDMALVIQSQIDRRIYISRHLVGGGADVRIRDMSASQREAFKLAVIKSGGASILNEGDHWHIEVDTPKSAPTPVTVLPNTTPKISETVGSIQNSDRKTVSFLNNRLLDLFSELDPNPTGPRRKVSSRTGKITDPGGIASAENQARLHAREYLSPELKLRFEKVAEKYGVSPALIAGIASRESGLGVYLNHDKESVFYGWGDYSRRKGESHSQYHGFGIMQIDKNTGDTSLQSSYGNTRLDPYSEKHIARGVEIFLAKLRDVQAKFPHLTEAQQLMTAVSRYNGGKRMPFPSSDAGTTGGDYANDTLIRARWFAANWNQIGK
jgi:LysM repeat protein